MQLRNASRLRTIRRTLMSGAFFLLALSGCSQPTSIVVFESPSPLTDRAMELTALASLPVSATIWSGGFETNDWSKSWSAKIRGDWGLENTEVITDPTNKFSQVLRVKYPAGSVSPAVFRKYNAPFGGAGFHANLDMKPQNSLRLGYYVRFSENFDFVKGGKLPGLFGGKVTSGGKIPDGTNGFSTRFMWRKDGEGEIYAYLPNSSSFGTSIGTGSWRFQTGKWHHIEQEVVLNDPGRENGRIRVWLDGEQVLEQEDLNFRSTSELKIEGIFFSTFFGGGDKTWATPKDVYIDFADFSVMSVS